MITLLEIGLSLLILGSIVFYLASALVTLRFFNTQGNLQPAASPSATPGVSILVPVCGVDAGAWDNWTSLCTQDYPDYEVLFGVTDPADPAIPVLQKLVQQFPDRASLYTDLKPRGINYKDSNLSYLLEAARHDLIIFADSDIQVRPDYIQIVTAPLADPTVGLVTCAFIAHNPQYLGAAIASTGRCFDFIPSLLLAQVVDGGLRCAVGVTMATYRERLAKAGGLHMNRIGSDYNLGKRFAGAGYRVELSPYVLESDTGEESITQVYQRELRWARTIRFNRGWQYYSMAFCYGTVYCLPLLLISNFAPWAITLSLITLLVRLGQVFTAIAGMQAPGLLTWLWTLPLREAMTFVIWAIGSYGQGVYWRGRHLRVEGDGLITQWEN